VKDQIFVWEKNLHLLKGERGQGRRLSFSSENKNELKDLGPEERRLSATSSSRSLPGLSIGRGKQEKPRSWGKKGGGKVVAAMKDVVKEEERSLKEGLSLRGVTNGGADPKRRQDELLTRNYAEALLTKGYVWEIGHLVYYVRVIAP